MYINLKKFTFLFGGLILLNEQIGVNALPTSSLRARQEDTSLGTWEIIGDSGVNAMHTVLVAPRKVIFIDKLEQNHLKRPDGLAALSSIYDLDTNEASPLGIYTNTFCSAGSFLGNGSLVEAGGDKGDANYRTGIQTVRVFDESIGDWHEIEGIMPSNRWYPAMVSLPNGNVLILGGSKAATGVNRADINNPSYTIFPPPTGTMEDTPLEFLTTALPYNLYPMCHVIPNFEGKTLLFIFANQNGIIYDLDTKTVVKDIPKIPGGIRSYPLTGTSVMLPLMSDTMYKPEIMICGGNKNYEVKSIAEASCGRLELTTEGAEWQMDDFGGTPRVMPDATYLVDGTILFVNGARYGFAGYRKGGGANAIWVNEDPVLYPTLYNTFERTYTNLAPSTIPRMYHSGSTLVPDGTVLIAGSNPQGGVSLNVKYPTEYRVERFTPPYLFSGIPRPTILTLETYEINKDKIPVYYDQVVTMVISVTGQNPILKAAIIHHGFITHSQNFSQRYVFLDIENFYADTSAPDQYIVTVKMPPNPTIISPGPSYLYVFNQNSPCVSGAHILLGPKTA